MLNSRTFGYGKYFVFYRPALTPMMIDECTKRSTTLRTILSEFRRSQKQFIDMLDKQLP
jgi:hypothetical protein